MVKIHKRYNTKLMDKELTLKEKYISVQIEQTIYSIEQTVNSVEPKWLYVKELLEIANRLIKSEK